MKFLIIIKEYRDLAGFISDRVLLDCSHEFLDYETDVLKIKEILGKFLTVDGCLSFSEVENDFRKLATIDSENKYEKWLTCPSSSYTDKLEIIKL